MSDADLRTITEVSELIERRELSPVTLARECLARIDDRPDLNAFITVLTDTAMDEAVRAEQELAAGRYRGPLHGIPISVKDLIDVAGTPTTSGSAVPPRRPSVDAVVVQRLRAAGAIIVGKTNLHEFAFGTTGDDTAFGAVRNPHDPTRSAGGSSSGAAVALIEGMCFASIGTDTGGSIRIPAAACGTVGLKPAYGEVPTDGVVALSPTCDHVGPLTRSVNDARLVLDALTGTPSPRNINVGPFTFGMPGGVLLSRVDRDVREALARARATLESNGHQVREVDIEHAALAPDIYLHIVLPEASEYHAGTLAVHAQAYAPAVRIRLEMGRYLLAEDYVRAMRLRRLLTAGVDRALERCDALLLPALAIPAPPLGATSVEIEGVSEPVRGAMLRLTQIFNLTGHPAIALPSGWTPSGLPTGIQLVAAQQQTARLLEIAALVEDQLAIPASA